MSKIVRRRPRRAKSGKTGKIIAAIIAALVIYCCVFSLGARMIKGDSMPMPLGFGAGVVLTGSMEPTLSENDLIIAVKAKEYSVGDIIVYQTGGTPVVHRVTEIDREAGVVTAKGDANNTEDPPFTISRIRGKVAFAVPYIGAAARCIKTVPGLIMVLVFIFTLFFLSVRAKGKEGQEDVTESLLEQQIEELKERLEAAAGGNNSLE